MCCMVTLQAGEGIVMCCMVTLQAGEGIVMCCMVTLQAGEEWVIKINQLYHEMDKVLKID